VEKQQKLDELIKKRKEEEKLENPFKPVIVTSGATIDTRTRFSTIDSNKNAGGGGPASGSSSITPNNKSRKSTTANVTTAEARNYQMRKANHKEIMALLNDQHKHNRIQSQANAAAKQAEQS